MAFHLVVGRIQGSEDRARWEKATSEESTTVNELSTNTGTKSYLQIGGLLRGNGSWGLPGEWSSMPLEGKAGAEPSYPASPYP